MPAKSYPVRHECGCIEESPHLTINCRTHFLVMELGFMNHGEYHIECCDAPILEGLLERYSMAEVVQAIDYMPNHRKRLHVLAVVDYHLSKQQREIDD